MDDSHPLSPGELSYLWNTYLANTMAVGVTQYFIETAKDPDVVELLKDALDLAVYEVQEAKTIFERSGHPHPDGFTSEDFNSKAPALFNDNIILLVKYILSQDAGSVYSTALAEAIHSDVRQYYFNCTTRTLQIIKQLVVLLESKGLFHPKVHLPVPKIIEKVHKQSFVGGWLSGQRPLNASEVTQILSNFRNMEVEREFLRAFIQVTSSKQLKEHFKRGEQIAKKHLNFFQSLLDADELPKQPTWESEITSSKIPPFSERLMLFKISVFVSTTVARYGTTLSSILRKDIGVDFTRLITELSLYGEDTSNLMIEFGFLDRMPLVKD